jgi:hypothetical protein
VETAVGIAPANLPLGQAVVAEEQVVRPEGSDRPPGYRRVGVDETRVIVEGAQGVDGRQVRVPGGDLADAGLRGAGGGGRVLGKQRQDDDPRRARLAQPLDAVRNGGGAVAHAQLHGEVGSELSGDRLAQTAAHRE